MSHIPAVIVNGIGVGASIPLLLTGGFFPASSSSSATKASLLPMMGMG
jgi:hypothetical protein